MSFQLIFDIWLRDTHEFRSQGLGDLYEGEKVEAFVTLGSKECVVECGELDFCYGWKHEATAALGANASFPHEAHEIVYNNIKHLRIRTPFVPPYIVSVDIGGFRRSVFIYSPLLFESSLFSQSSRSFVVLSSSREV